MIRWTASSPCRVCGGFERAPRGRGERCAGYLSDDGSWARCTRPEPAGALALDEKTSPASYVHWLGGPCRCGAEHRAVGGHNGSAPPRQAERRIVKTYPYRAADGGLLYECVRTAPKGFFPRHPDSSGRMAAGLPDGIQRVPYRLPELLAQPSRAVVWVEGEQDADRLADCGLIATTTVGGAASFRKHAAVYTEYFRGRRLVAVLPDNDEPGRAYAADVAAALHGVGAGVRVIELPGLPPKGDVSDWLDGGHTADELRQLVKGAPSWEPVRAENESRPIPPGVLLSEVKPERIRWLWPGRLAIGKGTMLDGNPGTGKSALTLDAASRVSTGTDWPDGSPCPRGGVVILTAEDGLADTVRPRLDAMGADTSRIVALPLVGAGEEARMPSIPADLAEVESAIRRVEALLLVIDPLMAFFGSDVSSHRDQDVRRALAPLASMAERTGVAVAIVRHLNKGNAGPAMYRGGGSIGIIGAARIALLVGRSPTDDQRIVIAPVKTNLAAPPPSLAFRLVPSDNGVVRLAWEAGDCDVTASELLDTPSDDRAGTVADAAAEALAGILAHGAIEAKVARRLAMDECGASPRTLDTAKAQLGIVSRREGFGPNSRVFWTLPGEGSQPPETHRTQADSIGRKALGVASYGEMLRPMESRPPETHRTQGDSTLRPMEAQPPETPPPADAPAPAWPLADPYGDEARNAAIVASVFHSNPQPDPSCWPEPVRSQITAELARRAGVVAPLGADDQRRTA